MPYKGTADLPADVKKKYSKGQQEAFVAAFNSAHKACMDDGGEAEECESSAFAIGHTAAKKKKNKIKAAARRCRNCEGFVGEGRAVFVSADLPDMIFVRTNGPKPGKFVWRDDHPEGQLCPYDDCAHDLAIPEEGWYNCGNCKRLFYARVSDSDYEDYVCYLPDERDDAPESTDRVAEDLGPSWGTPEEERSILGRLWQSITGLFKRTHDRAISIPDLYGQIDKALYSRDKGWPFIHNIYLEENDGSMYVVYSSEGKLFRAGFSYANGEVTLDDGVEVVVEHVPVGQQRIIITRQKDGSYRFLLVAASAVLNRVGEIDSTALFDDMIARAEAEDHWPVYVFYHQHRNENLRIGQIDYLARDDYLYIASGTFDDTEFGEIVRLGIEADPDYWGNSIGYYPIGEPEMYRVADDVEIPVYNAGLNEEISLCPENEAAAYFTSCINLEVNRTMSLNSKAKAALTKLMTDAGADEETVNGFLDQNDRTNRTIEDKGLIRRSKKKTAKRREEAAEVEEAEVEEAEVEEIEGEEEEVVLDDEAVDLIVAEVADLPIFQQLAEGLKVLGDIGARLGDLEANMVEIRTLAERVGDIEDVLEAALEEEEEEEYVRSVDLPRSRKVKVTARPRQRQYEEEDEFDTDAQVSTVLNGKIPNYTGIK